MPFGNGVVGSIWGLMMSEMMSESEKVSIYAACLKKSHLPQTCKNAI